MNKDTHKQIIVCNNVKRKFKDNHDEILELYKKNECSVIYKAVRRISLILFIFPKIWFDQWLDRCSEIDTLILFEVKNAAYIIKYLNKKYPNLRIILWFWNSLEDNSALRKIFKQVDRNLCELWSYNEKDCRKYGLKNNTQFYYLDDIEQNNVTDFDMYFLGADKNRTNILVNLTELFLKNNITYKYILTQWEGSIQGAIKYSNPITYEENIYNISRSKVVIDLVEEDKNIGVTLRPFEAFYYRKKLLTNNIDVKKLRIYHKSNIFILGEDDYDDLPQFIKTPFADIDILDLEFYSFENWKRRFIDR